MARETFSIRQGDRLPVLRATLRDRDGTVDLTSAGTILFHMRQQNGTAVVSGTAATYGAAAHGTAQYEWAAGDTTIAGTYRAEFECIFTGDKHESFPNTPANEFIVEVSPQVA
jgi:hypothetical protein